MKNYKQILEAINRGIQLALDDFDDEEQIQSVKSKQINHRDYAKEYLDLMNEVVDLGLPSGTLWCKYNLDVDSTKLLTPEDWYGGYYAWGELEGNKTNEKGEIYFDQSNYKFGEDYNKLTKYCNNYEYGLNGFTDNLANLQSEDDTAYQNKKLHNFKFHIPTKEQCEELINYTNNYWVNNYDPTKLKHNSEDDGGIFDLNGRIFEGKNGNQLFIPATGGYFRSTFKSDCYNCYLWSSSLQLKLPYNAYCLAISSNSILIYGDPRYNGLTIRPVVNL